MGGTGKPPRSHLYCTCNAYTTHLFTTLPPPVRLYDCTTYAQNERQHAVAATRPAPRPSQGVSRSGAAGNPTGAAATGAAPAQPSAMRVAHEARAQRARDAQRAAQDAHAALVGSHNFERPKSNRYIDQQSAPGFEAPPRARETIEKIGLVYQKSAAEVRAEASAVHAAHAAAVDAAMVQSAHSQAHASHLAAMASQPARQIGSRPKSVQSNRPKSVRWDVPDKVVKVVEATNSSSSSSSSSSFSTTTTTTTNSSRTQDTNSRLSRRFGSGEMNDQRVHGLAGMLGIGSQYNLGDGAGGAGGAGDPYGAPPPPPVAHSSSYSYPSSSSPSSDPAAPNVLSINMARPRGPSDPNYNRAREVMRRNSRTGTVAPPPPSMQQGSQRLHGQDGDAVYTQVSPCA